MLTAMINLIIRNWLFSYRNFDMPDRQIEKIGLFKFVYLQPGRIIDLRMWRNW